MAVPGKTSAASDGPAKPHEVTAIGSNLRVTKGFPEAISCRSSRLVSFLEIQNHVNDGFLTD